MAKSHKSVAACGVNVTRARDTATGRTPDHGAARVPHRSDGLPLALANEVDRSLAGIGDLRTAPEPLLPPALARVAALGMSAVCRDGLLG